MGAMQQILQGSAGVDIDPFFANVVLLMPFTASASVDLSPLAHSSGSFAGAGRSTTQSKFGGASWFFQDSSGSIVTWNSIGSEFNFGTGDFTYEVWWYPTVADFGLLWETGNSPFSGLGSFAAAFDSTRVILAGQANQTTNLVAGTIQLALNAWHWIVIQRAGTTWSLYVDGTRDVTVTSGINLTATGPTTIGGTSRNTHDSLTGYMNQLRMTKGVARYSGATITVPTAPFPTQ